MSLTQRLFTLAALFLFCLKIGAAQEMQFQPDLKSSENNSSPKPSVSTAEVDEIKRQLEEQKAEIEKLRAMVLQQAKIVEELRKERAENQASAGAAQVQQSSETIEKRLEKVETEAKKANDSIAANQFGSFGFSGELRVQYDSFYGQLNNSPNINNPSILGNELNSRHRGRVRLRLAVRGKLGENVFTGAFNAKGEKRTDKEFEWGFRLSSGSLANAPSGNQVLTDFFTRKPFALDQAFLAWRPRPLPGLKIQAGKFETPWMKTELTLDNDLNMEGISETYSRDIKHSFLKNITLHAWQLPMLERNATFVRNSDGSVNLDDSRHAGRDLALYGAQVQTRLALSPKMNLTFAVSDLNFSGTEAITPIQFLGNNLQLPVTLTTPASGTTPARTVTGVATIPRELLVAGNGNLGLSVATNAATNRDGRLASGFNLLDFVAKLDLNQFKYAPITLNFDYVRNTQTRDVLTAGANGANLFLPNHENEGYWAEIQIKNLRKNRVKEKFDEAVAGDVQFGYTFIRIEKDAVLSPFNYDDLLQQSDTRAHRFNFNYTVHPRITFNITGLVNQRANGLLGPFGNTPAGSLNGATTRLMFDTIFKF